MKARITIGTELTPVKLWNETTNQLKLADKIKVLGILRNCKSQTGIMVKVSTLAGNEIWLDLKWFEVKNEN